MRRGSPRVLHAIRGKVSLDTKKICPERDLNPHWLPNTPLKRARLPVPPPGLIACEVRHSAHYCNSNSGDFAKLKYVQQTKRWNSLLHVGRTINSPIYGTFIAESASSTVFSSLESVNALSCGCSKASRHKYFRRFTSEKFIYRTNKSGDVGHKLRWMECSGFYQTGRQLRGLNCLIQKRN
jgi:hypothetical protein